MTDSELSSSRGRILLAHRFFAPDVTTYSQMLRILGEHLHQDGHEVTVFSTQPSYNGVYEGPALAKASVENGLTVRRMRIPGAGSSVGRLAGGLVYGLLLILHCLRHRRSYDVVSVSTVPPVLMGLAGSVAARVAGARLVYHCMDLYPEIALASGLANDGPVTKLAKRLDMLTVQRAWKVIVLSEDMADTLARRGHHNRNVVVLNNFTIEDASQAAELPQEFARAEPGRFRVLFAGNLGRFQGLETVMEGFLAARDLEPSLELCFMGTGVMESDLREMAGTHTGDSVKFWKHSPLPVAMAGISDADLALVALSPRLIESAFPSKTLMYLEMGTPILGVVEEDSALSRLIEDENVGTVAPPGDADAFAKALVEQVRARLSGTSDAAIAARAKAAADRLFSQRTVLPKWSELYAQATVER